MMRPTQAVQLAFAAVAAVAAAGLVTLLSADGLVQVGAPACNTPATPFCSSTIAPPPGWTGPLFKLSQDYPQTAAPDARPWAGIDPSREPERYALAVLDYVCDGNLRPDVEESFRPELNTARRWYHVPWLDFGTNGREPLQGLTRERTSLPGELAPEQRSSWNNYAVGVYNASGGVAIGKVWADHGRPDPSRSLMPEGAVAAKLLFTTAAETEVPFLKGAPVWRGYVYKDVHADRHRLTDERAVLPLRLLQIDFAVRDGSRGLPTGWVFGTFIYGGGNASHTGSGWRNVAPVGVMWGNDPGYTGSGPLRETWLNPAVRLVHYGYQGRLNGPVDNPRSSCLSCHATAEVPQGWMMASSHGTPQEVARYFSNLPGGQPFTPGAVSTDYSLQLSIGIEQFQHAQTIRTLSAADRERLLQQLEQREEQPPRDGGSDR